MHSFDYKAPGNTGTAAAAVTGNAVQLKDNRPQSVVQLNKEKGRRRGGAILKNNNVHEYITSDFVSLHIANSAEEATTIAQHRVADGIDYCHVIDRSALPLLINELKERNAADFFPAAGIYQSACQVKIYEIKYTKKGDLKKPKILTTKFTYAIIPAGGKYALHHFHSVP